MILVHEYPRYTLLIGKCPKDLFDYFSVDEMHGLSLEEANAYKESPDDSYIAGLCNLSPTDNKYFVFINLTRCQTDVELTATLFHEMMHLMYRLFVVFNEEDFITTAEQETLKAVALVKGVKTS